VYLLLTKPPPLPLCLALRRQTPVLLAQLLLAPRLLQGQCPAAAARAGSWNTAGQKRASKGAVAPLPHVAQSCKVLVLSHPALLLLKQHQQ
jgi:hypothetical protein